MSLEMIFYTIQPKSLKVCIYSKIHGNIVINSKKMYANPDIRTDGYLYK